MMLRYHNARAVSKLPDSLFPVLRTQGVTRTDIYKTTITTILLTKPLFYYTTSTIFCLHQQSDNQTSLNCKIKFYSFFPRWILHLHELHLLLHIFYDSSASADGGRRRIMSKYIPDNHKHLTTQDRLYIEHSLDASTSFKDIARYLCKNPSTISKEIRSHRVSDYYAGKAFSSMHRTSASTGSIVKRQTCMR